MKIVNINTKEKHTVISYLKTDEEEIVVVEGWPGYHIINIDCEFEPVYINLKDCREEDGE